jgi:hypothetical protein
MRPVGAWPSDLLLKDPRLEARSSFGDSGGVIAVAAVSVSGELVRMYNCAIHILDGTTGAQTWSAN